MPKIPGGTLTPSLSSTRGGSPKLNSTGPNWAKAEGIHSLRPTTVRFGTDLGPTGPGQGVRRKGEALLAPEND